MKRKNTFFLWILAIWMLYMLFPSNNATSDSYGYAADIRYNLELFRPHHLLYSPVLYLIITPLKTLFSIDVLRAAQYINSICSVINLVILYKLLLRLQVRENTALLYILICAFSFSIWHFSGQNESYIIAVTFSLSGSWLYLISSRQDNNKLLILSGILATFACLLHQVMVFWWLGLGIGVLVNNSARFRNALCYFLPAVIVPLAYMLVIHFSLKQEVTPHTMLRYVFDYYFSPESGNHVISWKNKLFFCAAALIRMWIQVYGSILVLLKKSPVFYLPLVGMLAGCVLIGRYWHKQKITLIKPAVDKPFVRIHLLILALQLLFAFYSDGNFEFLVMAPYLAAILLSTSLHIPDRILSIACTILFIWNLLYGVLPDNIYDYTGNKKAVAFMQRYPDSYYLTRYVEMDNINAYQKGLFTNPKLLNAYAVKKDSIDILLHSGNTIYTDMIDAPKNISRGSIMGSAIDETDMVYYKRRLIDSIPGFYGTRYIYEIRLQE